MEMSLFIKKFKTQDFCYIYDVNTSEILRVDEIIYDLIDYVYCKSDEEIIAKLLSKYPKKKIKEALKEIRKAIEKEKIFMSNRPQKLKFRYNSNEIKEKLENELENFSLNLTENCNMRCKYCIYSGQYYFARTHSSAVMDRKTAFKSIDFFFNHNKNSKTIAIGFWGGEPLLEFKLMKECVKYARNKNRGFKRKLRFSFTTNGTLLNDNIIDFLQREKILLVISIDGPKKVHDQNRVFRNGNGTFDSVIKNILKIKNKCPKYYDNYVVFIVVMAPPFDLLRREEFFNKEGIFNGKTIKVNFMHLDDNSFFDNFDKDIFTQLSHQHSLIKKNYFDSLKRGDLSFSHFASNLYEHYFHKIHFRPVYSGFEKDFKVTALCIPGQLRPFVDVRGRLYICEKLVKPKEIGNIKTGFDISKIEHFINEFLDISNSECCNCWAIRFCSLCYSSALSGENFSIEKKNKICKGFKKNMEIFLIGYNEILEKNAKAFNYLAPVRQKSDEEIVHL